MADLKKTIEILFVGNDQLSGVAKDIGAAFGAFEGAAAPFANIADGVLALDAALAGAVAGGLALAYTKTIEFD